MLLLIAFPTLESSPTLDSLATLKTMCQFLVVIQAKEADDNEQCPRDLR